MDAAGLPDIDRDGELGSERFRDLRPTLFKLFDLEILPLPFIVGSPSTGMTGGRGGAMESVMRESTSLRLIVSIRRVFSLRSCASDV